MGMSILLVEFFGTIKICFRKISKKIGKNFQKPNLEFGTESANPYQNLIFRVLKIFDFCPKIFSENVFRSQKNVLKFFLMESFLGTRVRSSPTHPACLRRSRHRASRKYPELDLGGKHSENSTFCPRFVIVGPFLTPTSSSHSWVSSRWNFREQSICSTS